MWPVKIKTLTKIPRARLYRITLVVQRQISTLGLWQEDINTEIKLNIERHWSKEVLSNSVTHNKKSAYYVLPMFPYPSGNLHMGHVRVYSISDAIARFQKLSGNDVIHPIGWDAFGLPAENAAIEHDIPPDQWTTLNIATMKKQLLILGFDFDWRKEISTCDPQYYKWTQYIFLKLFEKGLAYQDTAHVNWDPVDKTVLADEQVDDQGCSWRSGAKVEKKILTQWFIKTTQFAKKLYDGLSSEHIENWKDIVNLQKHWIGECNGTVVTCKIKIQDSCKNCDIWSSDPYKFLHGQFITISTSNVIIQQLPEIAKENLKCYNPITDSEIPVFITDNVTYPEGRDIYIACPKICEEDKELAKSLNFSYSNESPHFDIDKENQIAIDTAQDKNVGGHFVSSKLKDWLISRQRYWGTPIPIIHCPDCGAVPVPMEDLPVKLPESKTFQSGSQTILKMDEWVNCKCPKCQSPAKRETDTMDTFVDSSWYFYRFLDPTNDSMPFSKTKLEGKTPVDIYIGGKEHAVLHLYYARFMGYFLHSLGWTPTEEPFKRLLVQGMIMGQSYKVKSSGKYIPADNVEKIGKLYKEKLTGEPVLVQWEKMSKSKYNGENPERLLSTYGCDTTRLLILADVPPATSRHWSDATLPGVLNWQHRLWITIRDFLQHRKNSSLHNSDISEEDWNKYEAILWESRNYFVATTTYHFKYTQQLSVGISRLQSLTKTLRNNIPPTVIARSKEFELALAYLIIMLSPVMPHFGSELWAGFLSAPNRLCEHASIKWNDNVLRQHWPKVDEHYKLSFQCKVDGVDRCELKLNTRELSCLNEDKALEMMVQEESVVKRIRKGISRTKYELYPDCRAILHIFTNRNVKNSDIEKSDNLEKQVNK